MEIKVHEKSGDYFTVIELEGVDTDWGAIHSIYACSCHCIYLNTDLDSFVEVYGAIPDCVDEVANNMIEVINSRKSHKTY